MKPDAAFTTLSDANPIPDAASFVETGLVSAAFLSATKERSERMETLERTEQTPTPAKKASHWQPLVAVAAFVIVLIIGAGVVAVSRGSSDAAGTPAPPFDTPQAAGEAYLVSTVANDFAAYQTLFAAGGTDWGVTPAGSTETDAEHIEARFVWISATVDSIDDIDCEPLSETTVRCSFMAVDPVLDRISGDGAALYRQNFTIADDGSLVSVSLPAPDFSEAQNEALQRFNEWVPLNRPEAIELFNTLWGSDPLGASGEEIVASLFDAADDYAALQQG